MQNRNKVRAEMMKQIKCLSFAVVDISEYLDSINARINARINEIELLRKYRDSILSGIVTGENDIRDIQVDKYEFEAEDIDVEIFQNEKI